MKNVPRVEDHQTAAEKPAPVQANTEAERQLVRQAQAGDSSAYEELVRIHHHRILAVVGGILRGGEDVEDIAQQALVKAYLSLKRFDQRSGFGTWLYKIAVNECWDYFRKKKVRRLVYESDLSEDQLRQMEATPDSRGSGFKSGSAIGRHVEQSDLLNRLLDEIDDKDRTMLVMKEVGGFTVEEIGDVLSLNVNTVKVRLFRARAKLVETYRRRLKGHTSVRSSKKA